MLVVIAGDNSELPPLAGPYCAALQHGTSVLGPLLRASASHAYVLATEPLPFCDDALAPARRQHDGWSAEALSAAIAHGEALALAIAETQPAQVGIVVIGNQTEQDAVQLAAHARRAVGGGHAPLNQLAGRHAAVAQGLLTGLSRHTCQIIIEGPLLAALVARLPNTSIGNIKLACPLPDYPMLPSVFARVIGDGQGAATAMALAVKSS